MVDANTDGSFALIGHCETTLSALIRDTFGKTMSEKHLVNEDLPHDPGYLSIGAEEKKSAR